MAVAGKHFYSGERRGTALIVLFCLGFLTVSQGAGQPAWYLESIEWVSSNQASEALLLVHSRLAAGREYNEYELSQAMVRIQQLPWVVSARFALRKGTQRHRYRLVITLQETSPFFLDINGQSLHAESGDSDDLYRGLAGFRHFWGRYAMVYGSMTPSLQGTAKQEPNGAGLRMGLSYFNLFNRGVLVDGQWAYQEGDRVVQDLGSRRKFLEYRPSQTGTLEIGVPLARYQWLRSRTSYETAGSKLFQDPASFNPNIGVEGFQTTERRRRSSLFWERSTINDSWLPSSGKTLRGGFSLADGRYSERFTQQVLDRTREWDTSSYFLDLQSYWPITRRQTLYLTLEGSFEETDEINDAANQVNLTQEHWGGRIGFLLFRPYPFANRLGDWALGVEAAGFGTDTETKSPQLDDLTLFSPLREYQIEVFVSFRSSWLIGKFSIRYMEKTQKTIFRKGAPLP